MASFAKIGLNGKVIEVQSVVNEVIHDSNKVEQESIGIDFLTKLTGYVLPQYPSVTASGGDVQTCSVSLQVVGIPTEDLTA